MNRPHDVAQALAEELAYDGPAGLERLLSNLDQNALDALAAAAHLARLHRAGMLHKVTVISTAPTPSASTTEAPTISALTRRSIALMDEQRKAS